jgi:hypothetical protein
MVEGVIGGVGQDLFLLGWVRPGRLCSGAGLEGQPANSQEQYGGTIAEHTGY